MVSNKSLHNRLIESKFFSFYFKSLKFLYPNEMLLQYEDVEKKNFRKFFILIFKLIKRSTLFFVDFFQSLFFYKKIVRKK